MANLYELIGERATWIVETIPDPLERARALEAIQICGDALAVVDGLDLAKHELAEVESSDLSTWNALAPEVRNLLLAVRAAADRLAQLCPWSEREPSEPGLNLDAAFGELEMGTPAPIRDHREDDIEAILRLLSGDARDDVARAISTLASMLSTDIVGFGQRLRNPRMTADRWQLLGELQELRSKCAQCLEAVLAAVVAAYTAEDLEVVLPRYQNQASRAVRLRAGVVDLAHDVEKLNKVLQAAKPEESGPLRILLTQKLNTFAEQPAYRLLRPADKRELIFFRLKLQGWAQAAPALQELRQAVEGFSKFLEVLRSINQREVLARHDRDRLQTLVMLLESEADSLEIAPHLEAIYGRSEALDRTIRRLRSGENLAIEAILEPVQEAHQSLRGAS